MIPKEEAPVEGTLQEAWHNLEVDEVIARLKTDPQKGLTSQEATVRFQKYGSNALQAMGRIPWYVVLARQFLDASF